MSAYKFDWDPAKGRDNLRKHGISFDEAETVFSDDQALLLDDPDHSMREERFVLLGLSAPLRLLLVVHSYRQGGETIRLMSARKATPTERAQYAAQWLR